LRINSRKDTKKAAQGAFLDEKLSAREYHAGVFAHGRWRVIRGPVLCFGLQIQAFISLYESPAARRSGGRFPLTIP
jgi:hypothetical protein